MKPKVGRNFTSERGEGVKGEVKNISLHWLQGIFETVPNSIHAERLCETQRLLQNTSTHFSGGGGYISATCLTEKRMGITWVHLRGL